ncbi:hypothetical protein EV356DRAFT_499795 [Viridothelium virens]|uniref:Trichothecene 3-O-acetyltransferase-like N-terminal domain-containing protein n=1 Tax=Viridothelium virens TaxID=1048519 RepID=A0A6A6HN99_VIRVR|nr:hypothetical protein EV356DRAFT_499795 [Viridothelium virens]
MSECFRVPGPPFDLRLSRWDMRMMPVYSQRCLCFPLPGAGRENVKKITDLLYKALEATVEELPFLAGYVKPLSKEQSWLRNLYPGGAAYLEVHDLTREIDYLNLRQGRFASSLLDSEKLCPFPKSAYVQEDPIDVCRLRANFVAGGLILVLSIIHTACDGRGITDVLTVFADKLRQIDSGELTYDASTKPGENTHTGQTYSFDRSALLSGNGIPGSIENHLGWTATPRASHASTKFVSATNVCANFLINRDTMQALKFAAFPPKARPLNSRRAPDGYSAHSQLFDHIVGISTHDAVTALLWRSIMRARQGAGILARDAIVHFSTAVDCRTRLGLPKPYYGNTIYGVRTALSLDMLVPVHEEDTENEYKALGSLHDAATAIRTAITDATGPRFRDLLGFVERTDTTMLTRLAGVDDLSVGSVFVISYFGFEMHTLDFGRTLGGDNGHIEAFRLPSRGIAAGVPIVLPRLPDGSCELVINEREDVMALLLADPIFMRFASQQK